MPVSIGICTRSGCVRIPIRRYNTMLTHPGTTGMCVRFKRPWQGGASTGRFAARATAEPALTLDRWRGSCAGYSFASAMREVRGRAAVLDRAGELDR